MKTEHGSNRAILSCSHAVRLWFQIYPEGTCIPSPLRALSIIWAALHRSLAFSDTKLGTPDA